MVAKPGLQRRLTQQSDIMDGRRKMKAAVGVLRSKNVLQLAMAFAMMGLCGCASYLPYSGPRTSSVVDAGENKALAGIQVVDVNYALARLIKDKLEKPAFSSLADLANANPNLYTVGPGDTLQVYIWEAPPAMLFTSVPSSMATPSGSMMTTIPEQIVSSDGDITMPFAGKISCSGRTLTQIEAEIRQKLRGQANDPQVVVSLVNNYSRSVTVVGNVAHSTSVPLVPGGVNVLQALAAAGGVDKPVNKVTMQISRAGKVVDMPLESVIKNPQENISLHAGDILTALYEPLHVTILGATTQSRELDFEATGVSLSQALARAGGLNGHEADAKGVFVFRFEKPSLLPQWPHPVQVAQNGLVPVVFRFDLSNPATLFAAQTFPIQNHDLIYVGTAPITELQKFLGMVVQIVYPIQGLTNAGVLP